MIGLIYSFPLQPTSPSFTLLQTYWPLSLHQIHAAAQCLPLPGHPSPKELHDFISFSFKCLSNVTLSTAILYKSATLSHYLESPLAPFFMFCRTLHF